MTLCQNRLQEERSVHSQTPELAFITDHHAAESSGAKTILLVSTPNLNAPHKAS